MGLTTASRESEPWTPGKVFNLIMAIGAPVQPVFALHGIINMNYDNNDDDDDDDEYDGDDGYNWLLVVVSEKNIVGW